MQEKNLSEIIRERVQQAKVRYHCNDNIADYIKDGELDLLVDEVAGKMEGVLQSLVIDTANDHNTRDTAQRVAKNVYSRNIQWQISPCTKSHSIS